MPSALAAFVLAAVETSAIGRMFAQKHGYRFDANQELLAIGVGNLVAGLGRGFPVSGGMSQSLVNESAGARTPLSGLVAALFTLFVVLFASGLLRNLPQPVLAAIVLAAVMSLVDVHALKAIWHFSRTEFVVAMVALAGVLGSGPANGVLLGAAISIVLLLRQASRPRVAELGRVAGTRVVRRPGAPSGARRDRPACSSSAASRRCSTSTSTTCAIACRSSLAARPDPVRLVVLFLGLGAADRSRRRRTGRGTPPDARGARRSALRLADAHGEVRDALRRIGFARPHGTLESGQTVDAVLSEWQARQPAVIAPLAPRASRRFALRRHSPPRC